MANKTVETDLEQLMKNLAAMLTILSGSRSESDAVRSPRSSSDENFSPKLTEMISLLPGLLALFRQVEAARNGVQLPVVSTSAGHEGADDDLTPVNAALGETIGRALNGRKTVTGTLGLLLTTLLPPLEALIPGLAPVAAAVKAIAPFAIPIFTALTGWGALGKIDKKLRDLPRGRIL